jgi:hypothetical protein
MTTPTNVFYGGGHSMKTGNDFAYWCLANCSMFYKSSDQFVLPIADLGNYYTYSRIAGCASQAGVIVPPRYTDFLASCEAAGTIITPTMAMDLRGAVLFGAGIIYVSMGDSTRLVYQDDGFRLVMKYLNSSVVPDSTFDYGAQVPGMEY